MTRHILPTSCKASFLPVAGLRHHVTARDEKGNLPFPYAWCPNPQWKSDAQGTAISVSGRSWSLDGRWARGSPAASHLPMHCGAASWGRDRPHHTSACMHSLHPHLPRPPPGGRTPVFAGQGSEEEAGKGSAYQGSQGQQWPLGAAREVEAKWGLGHQELQGRWLRTHPRGWQGVGPYKS